MAEASAAWSRRSPWTGVLPAGRRPDDRGTGITIEPRDDLGFAAVVARKGRAEELRKTLFSGHAVEAPVRPALARGRELDLVWNGPERWLAISSDRAIAARLSGELGRLAAICDQSDALAILRIAGPEARAVLAKGCPIDLHPRAFRPGFTLSPIASVLFGPAGARPRVRRPRGIRDRNCETATNLSSPERTHVATLEPLPPYGSVG